MSPAAHPLVLLRHRAIPDLSQLAVYRASGGYAAFTTALTQLSPAQVLAEVKASGLRGRGGAGFPTGIKWGFLPADRWPHYVVANADESEPGTFEDRELLEESPYQFLEGLALACYAVGARVGYIYLRGEFWPLAAALDGQIAQLEAAGLLGERLLGTDYALRLYTHLGAGAYICGEETALLESLEGKLGQPRLRPPFPATAGLYGQPTVINNVETLANLPPIIDRGAAWYRTIGTEKSPGTKIFSLSGRINRPGNYELPLGTRLGELVYEWGGGIPDGRPFKALLPAGASSSLIAITDDSILDTPMDYEAMTAAGSPLGSASMIIVDDTVDIDWLVNKTVHFFAHESCGKCTPCREGTYWMAHVARRITEGKAAPEDIALLDNIAAQIQGKCLCALGEFSTMAVRSGIEKFRADFEARMERVPNG
jgi:NADH-quinone oxidoreductase subunit F